MSQQSYRQAVVSYYPLSSGYKSQIVNAYGPVQHFLTLGSIRNLGLTHLIAHMRNLEGDRLFIAIESSDSNPLIGPMRILALVAKFRLVLLCNPDGDVQPMPFWKVLPLISQLVLEQLSSRIFFLQALSKAYLKPRRKISVAIVERSFKRVVFLDANLSFGLSAGGSVGHIKGVIDGLVDHGFELRYISSKPIPTSKTGSEYVPVSAPRMLAFPAELNYYTHQNRFRSVARQSLANKPACFIYQRMSLHNISGVELAQQARVPLVLEYNGSEVWTAHNWGSRLALHNAASIAEKYIIRSADIVVAVSEPLANQIRDLGVPNERIVTYPNCIDPGIFSPHLYSPSQNNELRRKLGIPLDAKICTFIGTFGAWHGIEFLAQAICRLIDSDKPFVDSHKLRFLLIGDGLKKSEVESLVGRLPYSDYVTMTGLIPQKIAPNYLSISDFFLSPHMPNPDGTPFFGSPTKLFEYMAMQKPIIAADLDQIGTILRGKFFDSNEGDPLGFLYPPGEIMGILAALKLALENPEIADRRADLARAHVLENFTWYRHVGKILERLYALNSLPK